MKKNISLKILRARNDLTIGEMAERLEISRQTYSSIENGRQRGTIKFWGKVQRTFELSGEEMWQLINGEESKEIQNVH